MRQRNKVLTLDEVKEILKGTKVIHKADLSGLSLSGLDFSGATLEGCTLINTSFKGCTFNNSELSQCYVSPTTDFSNSTFKGGRIFNLIEDDLRGLNLMVQLSQMLNGTTPRDLLKVQLSQMLRSLNQGWTRKQWCPRLSRTALGT